jgi:hypothetical protein
MHCTAMHLCDMPFRAIMTLQLNGGTQNMLTLLLLMLLLLLLMGIVELGEIGGIVVGGGVLFRDYDRRSS